MRRLPVLFVKKDEVARVARQMETVWKERRDTLSTMFEMKRQGIPRGDLREKWEELNRNFKALERIFLKLVNEPEFGEQNIRVDNIIYHCHMDGIRVTRIDIDTIKDLGK